MDENQLKQILEQVARGEMDSGEALARLGSAHGPLPGGVMLDHHRCRRTGIGEVVFGRGKSNEQLEHAIRGLAAPCPGESAPRPVLATKCTPEQGAYLAERIPEGTYWARAELFCLHKDLDLAEPWATEGEVIVVSAGSSDLPVALEALGSARFFGFSAGLVTDVGVAGLHRVGPHLDALNRAGMLVVVAGMEGALPSVLGGLVKTPIVAVPTSIGYGASFQGVAALLGMLNSCAPGLAVVNIDNGFGGAAFAAKCLKPRTVEG